MTVTVRLFVIACALLFATSASRAGDIYKVVQSISTKDGRLQILEDARLSPSLERKMWDSCVNPSFILDESDPQVKVFAHAPLRPAEVRQVDDRGHQVAIEAPDAFSPIAKIEGRRLGPPSGTVYLVDVNNSACFGSYSGRGVLLMHFDRGVIRPVLVSHLNEKPTGLHLFNTLKTDWRIADPSPNHTVINYVLCRPDASNPPKFTMRYITYRFDGSAWRATVREEPGFWESDQGFPDKIRFP